MPQFTTQPKHLSKYFPLLFFTSQANFNCSHFFRYYSAPSYYTTEAPVYYTTTYAPAPVYYATEAPKYVFLGKIVLCLT